MTDRTCCDIFSKESWRSVYKKYFLSIFICISEYYFPENLKSVLLIIFLNIFLPPAGTTRAVWKSPVPPLSRVPLRFQRATTCASTLYPLPGVTVCSRVTASPPTVRQNVGVLKFFLLTPLQPPTWSAQWRQRQRGRITFIWTLSTSKYVSLTITRLLTQLYHQLE